MRSRKASFSRSASDLLQVRTLRAARLQFGFHLAASSLDFGSGNDVAIDFGDDLLNNADIGGGE